MQSKKLRFAQTRDRPSLSLVIVLPFPSCSSSPSPRFHLPLPSCSSLFSLVPIFLSQGRCHQDSQPIGLCSMTALSCHHSTQCWTSWWLFPGAGGFLVAVTGSRATSHTSELAAPEPIEQSNDGKAASRAWSPGVWSLRTSRKKVDIVHEVW